MKNDSGSLVGQLKNKISGSNGLTHYQNVINQGFEAILPVGQWVSLISACPTMKALLCLSGSVGHRRLSILQGYIYYIYIPDRLTRKKSLTHCFSEVK
jgi:hypothetical protein